MESLIYLMAFANIWSMNWSEGNEIKQINCIPGLRIHMEKYRKKNNKWEFIFYLFFVDLFSLGLVNIVETN